MTAIMAVHPMATNYYPGRAVPATTRAIAIASMGMQQAIIIQPCLPRWLRTFSSGGGWVVSRCAVIGSSWAGPQ